MADGLVKGLGAGNMELAEDFELTSPTGATLFKVPSLAGDHARLNSGYTNSDIAGKTVRINGITNTGTANDLIGFQCKPGQGVATAKNVVGCEISPRVNDTFALTGIGSLIGMTLAPLLKGTTGDIGGDVRGMQIEMTTDDASTRTTSGDVVGLRFRTAYSGTITGSMWAMSVEKPEVQTNSKTYDALMNLTSTIPLVWNDTPATEPSNADGYIKVVVNGSDRYIQLYSVAPTD